MKIIEAITKSMEELEDRKDRSAWDRGVTNYAYDLLEELKGEIESGYYTDVKTIPELKKALLNGANDWSQYSWGGCALIYDYEIAERLCNPSELKKTRNGERKPNRNEEWLDVQAMALYQACNRITKTIRKYLEA